MLKIVLEEGNGSPDLARPLLLCDSCGEEIDDYTFGLAVWDARSDTDFDSGKPVELYTVHKRACDYALADRLGRRQSELLSDEIRNLPLVLGLSMGLDTKEKWGRATDGASYFTDLWEA